MKKILILLTTLILLLTCVLTACSGGENNTDEKTSQDDNSVNEESSVPEETKKPVQNYMLLTTSIVLGNNNLCQYEDYEYTVFQFNEHNFNSEKGKFILTTKGPLMGIVGDDGVNVTVEPSEETVNSSTIVIEDNGEVKPTYFIAVRIRYCASIVVTFEPDEPVEPEPEIGTTINGVTYYFENEDIRNVWQGEVLAHDYCTCGATGYWYSDEICGYTIFSDYDSQLRDYFIKNGSITSEEYEEFESLYQHRGLNNRDSYISYLPYVYQFIKYFDITKEDFLEFQKQQIRFAQESGYIRDGMFTERQLEILFGDYSDEVVMREFKNEFTYYKDGKLYDISTLSKYADDELLKELLKEDDFRLWLYDVRNLGYGVYVPISTDFLNRIDTLLAEMEAE